MTFTKVRTHKVRLQNIAISIKSGVKDTTTKPRSLAIRKKVLLIDADPQGDLTTCLGWQDTDNLGITLATKLTDVINETMNDPTVGILHHDEGVELVPANLELSAMEFNLVNAMSRETALRNYLSEVKDKYDYILIDCMPSLGMVTINALSAADSVIIPVQAQYLPAKGMTQLVHFRPFHE
jgi:chromosome partitioning protein